MNLVHVIIKKTRFGVNLVTNFASMFGSMSDQMLLKVQVTGESFRTNVTLEFLSDNSSTICVPFVIEKGITIFKLEIARLTVMGRTFVCCTSIHVEGLD